MNCPCGHPASEHDLVDHDERADESTRDWRKGTQLARWHWLCTADVHPEGAADSPWDHVCGCLESIYDFTGAITVNVTTDPEKVSLMRDAVKAAIA